MVSDSHIRAARAFGLALKAARTERGMSQEDVAGECEFDRAYPSLLERGRRSPTFFVIVQLARALRMQPVMLFADAVARLRKEDERP
jgi:XRE family transcriptional regulator, regulator of sulfur utilization